MGEFNFAEELKKMPQTPGVYLMHDAHDDVLHQAALLLHDHARDPAGQAADDDPHDNAHSYAPFL